MASRLLASKTLIPQNHTFFSPKRHRILYPPSALNHQQNLPRDVSKPRAISFRSTAVPQSLLTLHNPKRSTIVASSSAVAPNITHNQARAPAQSLVTGSTWIIKTIAAIILAASKLLAYKIVNLDLQFNSHQSLIHSVGPACFAAIGFQAIGTWSTPVRTVAIGMAKWLDIYLDVLMLRALLSWFPNLPWEKQPFSAIRDLCDPYLFIFRNVIPPIGGKLDVNPFLAFGVLGVLNSILNGGRRVG